VTTRRSTRRSRRPRLPDAPAPPPPHARAPAPARALRPALAGSAAPLLTTGEVAALLRVHPKHVYRLLRKGLPARRVGSEWRFLPAEVLEWSRPDARRAPGPPAGALDAGAASGPGGDPSPSAAAPGRARPPLVAANGDLVVLTLLRLLVETGTPVGMVPADRDTGARLLAAGAVVAAGAHAGSFPTHVGGERVARVHLVTREIGLVGRPGAAAPRVEDLPRLRLASRPPTAGVRLHLDDALRAAGLDPAALHRGVALYRSHQDVACAVAAGEADAGVASRAWGARLGLPFTPLAREAYGLIVRAGDLGEPAVVRICEVAQRERFRAEMARVPGYDASGAGDVRYDP
jgi:putative molybdopterin biosynthesis protein